MTNFHTLDLAELSDGLAKKAFSSRELTQHFLTRIEAIDPKLNSFVTVTGEQALAQADAADARRAAGENNLLLGIPLAQKDIFCTEGVKTTCGSKMLANFTAPYNATVVEKLHHAHGMPMLGKTNMDEFAMGSSNETSFFGNVANPWETSRVPGGSSGGSAAAVAAGLCPAATGTDTGGSIRQPAALCGITGIKPSYGRVSRYGMIAFASSLDQGGIFARSAADCALILEAMSGFDPRDSSSVNSAVPNYFESLQNNKNIKNLKIGLPKEYFADGLDSSVRDMVLNAAKTYESLGAELVEISLPNTHLAVPTYYVVAPAEASSNLARFDGVRYGYRCENPKDLTDLYVRSRAEGFGREVQRRIMVGAYVLSAGYYDAYYLKAQQVRRLIAEDFTRAFTQVDVILGPTTTNTAFALGDKLDDPVAMYLNDLYTIPANLAGLPGMSLPCGFVDGLPVGMQLVGAYDAESQLLNVAHAYQMATPFHKAMPDWVK